jgi:4-amino-4-deoxy-L-arabinose transferase-like glycosyltransferase
LSAITGQRAWTIALAAILAITILRVIVLFTTSLELYPDEAQYWWWATHPDWGYFSKPPLIAWLIAGTMSVCGDGEGCIRLASPLLHGGTALVLFGLTRRLYDANTALWTSLLYLTLPGISYSAQLISTDVPLLFFWSVALFAFVRMHETAPGRWRWALLCGAAIGLGCLSKYAMLYFVLGLGLAVLVSRESRRAILSLNGLIIVAVAALVFAPNILWNINHQFATVQHTAANANWARAGENIANLGSFIAGQFGVFGPMLMAAYLYGAWRVIRPSRSEAVGQQEDGRDVVAVAGRVLLCFSAPILLIITVQSVISDANANWAAAAYVAATPLAVHTILSALGRWAAWTSASINAVALIALTVFALWPSVVEGVGLGNAYKRFHGWRTLGHAVIEEAAKAQYEAVVVDNRSVTASLLYYARPLAVPIRVLDADEHPDNHFQMTLRLEPSMKGLHLLVSHAANPARVLSSFARSRLTRTLIVPIGGGKTRKTNFFAVEGYRGPTRSSGVSR